MEWKRRAEHDDPWTWVGHAFLNVVVPLILAMIVQATWGAWGLETFNGGLIAFGGYYFLREAGDETKARKAGTWGERKRADRVGDLVGPVTSVMIGVSSLCITHLPWWSASVVVVGTTLGMVHATVRVLRRGADRGEAR